MVGKRCARTARARSSDVRQTSLLDRNGDYSVADDALASVEYMRNVRVSSERIWR